MRDFAHVRAAQVEWAYDSPWDRVKRAVWCQFRHGFKVIILADGIRRRRTSCHSCKAKMPETTRLFVASDPVH